VDRSKNATNKNEQNDNQEIQNDNKQIQNNNKEIQNDNKQIQNNNKEIQNDNKEIQNDNKAVPFEIEPSVDLCCYSTHSALSDSRPQWRPVPIIGPFSSNERQLFFHKSSAMKACTNY